MADDTLPMPTLFRSCREVAEACIAPLHYTELTRLAFERLGVSKDRVNWSRQIEDVREKLLVAGQHGFGYVGSPHCLAYLKEWVSQQAMLNPLSPIRLSANLEASERAVFEGLLRKFLDKTGARPETIARSRARGLLIQEHVRSWFTAKWPKMVLPPDNEGEWERPCDHDFKLNVNGRVLRVDVAGPRATGDYGRPQGGGKKGTDVHIIASIVDDSVAIHGFVPGRGFADTFTAWDTQPICRMAFWLNCAKLQLDYSLFRNSANRAINKTVATDYMTVRR